MFRQSQWTIVFSSELYNIVRVRKKDFTQITFINMLSFVIVYSERDYIGIIYGYIIF